MKKVLCILLVLCTVLVLAACAQPTDKELRQELTVLVSQAAADQLGIINYCRVSIDAIEKDGKNQWAATGNINFSDSDTSTIAILYTATLRYDKSTKSYTADVTFGEVYYL